MPATRMIHPDHGATHAYDEGEIAKLKAVGWSVEGEAVAIPGDAPETVVPIVRRGRPPKAK
jgi:hypothetical protein